MRLFAFAELEEFIDDPLRTYSAGMVVRLAFAAAISADPELLIIDEVLAVGDLAFQRKCFQRLEQLRQRGTTILLASHDEGQVRAVCDRVVWLAHGRIEVDGTADEAFDAYRHAARVEVDRRTATLPPHVSARRGEVGIGDQRFGTLEAEITEVRISPTPVTAGAIARAHPVSIELELVPHVPVHEPIISVSLSRVREEQVEEEQVEEEHVEEEHVVNVNSASDGVRLGYLERPTRVLLILDRLDVPPGHYHVNVGMFERNWSYVYDYHWQLHRLELTSAAGASFGPPRRWSLG